MTHRTRTHAAALALAVAGTLTASLCLGVSADATGTAPTSPDVRMDDLLHPADIVGAFGTRGTITSRVGRGDGANGLSACTGETRVRDVVGKAAHVFHAELSARNGAGATITVEQHVADQASADRATTTYRAVVADLRQCQHEEAGHWRYGTVHRLGSGAGAATWMPVIDGDGTRDGGVVVARSGRHLAVVEVMGAAPGRQVQRLAAATVRRLG